MGGGEGGNILSTRAARAREADHRAHGSCRRRCHRRRDQSRGDNASGRKPAQAGPNPRSVPDSLVGGRACSRADVPGTARPRGWLPERAGRRETARRGSARAGDGGLNSPPPMAPPTPARPANLSGTRGKWGGGWAARGRRCVCTDGKDFITGTLRAYIASVVYQGYGHQARSEAQQALYSAAAGGGLACEALGPRLAGVAVIGGGALPVEVVGVHLLLPPARHTQNRISQ